MTEATPTPDLRTRLRELRKARGWNQTYVAKALGTTAQTISRLETNVMTVSTDWLVKFADLFGVSPSELISEPGSDSVDVIGHVRSDGAIIATAPSPLPVNLQVSSGLAVKLDDAMGPYREASFLIATRLEDRNLAAAIGQTCVVENSLGALWLAKVIKGFEDRVTLIPLTGSAIQYDQKLKWAARIAFELNMAS